MLQRIYNLFQGWLAWVVVLFIAFAFILWGVDAYLGRNATPSRTVAKVNGDKISEFQLSQAYENLRLEQQRQLGEDFILSPEQQNLLRQQALNYLVTARALLHDARKSGFWVNEEQAQLALLNIPEFNEDGQFSSELFQQTLRRAAYSPQQFIQELQERMLVDQYRTGIIASEFTLPEETDQIVNLIDQRRDFKYLRIPAESFSQVVQPSEQDEQDYYQANPAAFNSPEQTSIEYLELSFQQILSLQTVSAQQAESFYQSNLSAYTRPAQWQVAHILVAVPTNATQQQLTDAQEKLDQIQQDIADGIPFAKVAETYSDDLLSGAQGGELPQFSEGSFDINFTNAAAKLDNPGDISEPFRTQYGFEIIQLLNHEPSEQTSFSEVEQAIKNQLARDMAQRAFAEQVDALANTTFANPDSLQPAADLLDLQIQSTGFFTQAGETQGLLANSELLQAAFSEPVRSGENSDLIQVDPETVVVFRVKAHQSAALKPFDEVRDQIREHLVSSRARSQAQQLGEQLLSDLQQGEDPQAQLDEHGLSWQVLTNVSMNEPPAEVDPFIVQAGFQLPRPRSGSQLPSNGIQLSSGDYAIIQITQVTDGNPGAFDPEELRALQYQIESSRGLLDYEFYIEGLLERVKITYSKISPNATA